MNKLTNSGVVWRVIVCLIGVAFILFNSAKFEVTDIIQMHFAPSWDAFRQLASRHDTQLLNYHLGVDFVFILLYTVLFYLAIKILESSLSIKVNKMIFILCLIPGIFDLIENFYFLSFIKDLNSEPSFWPYKWAVRVKWFFAIGFTLMNLTIAFYYGLVYFSKYYDWLFGRYHGVK